MDRQQMERCLQQVAVYRASGQKAKASARELATLLRVWASLTCTLACTLACSVSAAA